MQVAFKTEYCSYGVRGCAAPQKQWPLATRFAARRRAAVQAQASSASGEDTAVPLSRRHLFYAAAAATAASSVTGPTGAAMAVGAGTGLPVVPTAPLSPSLSVSRVIKGCWQLSGGHRGDKATDRTEGRAAISDFQPFVDGGITSFDMADHYGPAEALAGRFLSTDPSLRDRCQLLTKYCVFGGLEMTTVTGEAVRKAVDTSRRRLGVDSIDLMQFYWGSYDIPRYVDAALYLMDMKAEGAIKEIGVTNFDVPRLEKMVNAGVQIVSNQVQYSLLDRRPRVAMVDYCAANGISLLPYGVLAGSFLSDKYLGVDVKDVRADTYSKGKYSSVLVESVGGWSGLQRLLSGLKPIADKHDTTIANVAARWVLQQPQVPAVIIGARNASHVDDHRRLFSFQMDGDDLAAVDGLLADTKKPTGDCYDWERGGKF